MIDYAAAAGSFSGEPEVLETLEDAELRFELTVAHLHPDRRERFELVVRELLNRRRGYGRNRQPRHAVPESIVKSTSRERMAKEEWPDVLPNHTLASNE